MEENLWQITTILSSNPCIVKGNTKPTRTLLETNQNILQMIEKDSSIRTWNNKSEATWCGLWLGKTAIECFCGRRNVYEEVLSPPRLGNYQCTKMHERWKEEYLVFYSMEMCSIIFELRYYFYIVSEQIELLCWKWNKK